MVTENERQTGPSIEPTIKGKTAESGNAGKTGPGWEHPGSARFFEYYARNGVQRATHPLGASPNPSRRGRKQCLRKRERSTYGIIQKEEY